MKKYIFAVFFVLKLTCLSAAPDFSSTPEPLSPITVQYKWFDNAENRSKGIAPSYFISTKPSATDKFQKLSFPLFVDSSKSVYEILEYIKAMLGVPTPGLKVRLGISRKDRVNDIPLKGMHQVKKLKVRYVEPKKANE